MSHVPDQISGIRPGDHACLVHDPEEDPSGPVVAFFRGGLVRDQDGVFLGTPEAVHRTSEALRAGGVAVAAEESGPSGAGEEGGPVDAGGSAPRIRMLSDPGGAARAIVDRLREVERRALDEGRAGVRVAVDMGWALGPGPRKGKARALESRLVEALRGGRSALLCVYDRRLLGPDSIRAALRAHPLVIAGGRLHPNPFCRPPELAGVPEAGAEVEWMIGRLRSVRSASEALEEANRAKADFLAVVSHELRTPLAAVMGYAGLLREGIPGPVNEAQLGHLDRIDASARHLLELIEEILSFANLDAGVEEVRPAVVDPAGVAEEALDLVRHDAREKGLALRAGGSGPARPVRTDAARLRRILVNLLSNAVKYTAEGAVELAWCAEGEGIRFTVTDTGRGIREEDMERIFEPFTVLGDVCKRSAPGTGLGLAVARRLALLLGGRIEVTSAVGRGSAFQVVVPPLDEGSAPARAAAARPPAPDPAHA